MLLHVLALGDITESEDEENNDDGPPVPHSNEARVGELAATLSAPNICVPTLHEHDYL